MLEPFDDILLFPGESPQDLADLQTHWSKDFPGTSFTAVTLRQDLIRADWNRRRALRLLSELYLDLHATGLPQTHWDRFTIRHLHFFERSRSAAQKEFCQSFRLLQALKPVPVPIDVAPPELPPPPVKARLRQNVWVAVLPEGKISTRVDMEPPRFLEQGIESFVESVARDFHFQDSVVPEPYLYVLEDDGDVHPPTQHLHIAYELAEFQRLCRLEIETKAPYLLDGKRVGYRWDKDTTQ